MTHPPGVYLTSILMYLYVLQCYLHIYSNIYFIVQRPGGGPGGAWGHSQGPWAQQQGGGHFISAKRRRYEMKARIFIPTSLPNFWQLPKLFQCFGSGSALKKAARIQIRIRMDRCGLFLRAYVHYYVTYMMKVIFVKFWLFFLSQLLGSESKCRKVENIIRIRIPGTNRCGSETMTFLRQFSV